MSEKKYYDSSRYIPGLGKTHKINPKHINFEKTSGGSSEEVAEISAALEELSESFEGLKRVVENSDSMSRNEIMAMLGDVGEHITQLEYKMTDDIASVRGQAGEVEILANEAKTNAASASGAAGAAQSTANEAKSLAEEVKSAIEALTARVEALENPEE